MARSLGLDVCVFLADDSKLLLRFSARGLRRVEPDPLNDLVDGVLCLGAVLGQLQCLGFRLALGLQCLVACRFLPRLFLLDDLGATDRDTFRDAHALGLRLRKVGP